jgi:hypothetical protein
MVVETKASAVLPLPAVVTVVGIKLTRRSSSHVVTVIALVAVASPEAEVMASVVIPSKEFELFKLRSVNEERRSRGVGIRRCSGIKERS